MNVDPFHHETGGIERGPARGLDMGQGAGAEAQRTTDGNVW